jgi:hypothetical protein
VAEVVFLDGLLNKLFLCRSIAPARRVSKVPRTNVVFSPQLVAATPPRLSAQCRGAGEPALMTDAGHVRGCGASKPFHWARCVRQSLCTRRRRFDRR